MFYRTYFPRDLHADFDRLQRELAQSLEWAPSIRGLVRGGFPAMNVGTTPQSVELDLFAPGIDPTKIEVNLEKGVLTVAGERPSILPKPDAGTTVHLDQRFTGRFRRVVTLPDDVDPNAVEARYRDGVLHVSIQRRAPATPRRITIQ